MKNRKHNLWLITVLALTLALAAGCGEDNTITPPSDDTTRQTIGAAGGTLDRSGEASLEVPPGALAGDVDFTMDENTSPTAMGTGRQFASEAFTIGPAGTQFNSPAEITIHYDEADLGSADESTIVIYTDNGTGWSPLATTVNEATNTASAEVNHLSDYCATIPYGEAADGVYALLELVRAVNYAGSVDFDIISARFDTIVDPCNVHYSLHPDSVYCNEYKLAWDNMIHSYLDQNTGEFLVLGENYEFEVFGNGDVPDLVQSINFPTVAPIVTNITNDQVLSLDGFTVEWDDTDASDVLINIISGGDQLTVVRIETANDGSYTFSSADLADLTAGTHALDLRHFTVEFITADGYDPNSTIGAGTTNITLINLTAGGGIGPDGGILPLGDDDGHLDIPSGALTTEVDFTATVNSTPTAAPEGWAFMTPVYTIEPTGTTFAVDAELHFDYDESDLNGNDESSIAIFTDTGSGWVQIASEVYESMDYVEADIDHLSDFVAMVEVDIPAEGVYCELLVRRTMNYSAPDIVVRFEIITARFDEAVSADPVTPLDVDGVTLGIRDLTWDPDDQDYSYGTMIHGEMLTLGDDYTFTIDGDDDVPDLTQVITFISHEPYLTNLATADTVYTSGFDVEWGGADGGMVHLTIYGEDDLVAFTVETENDGLYEITADDLEDITVMVIGLELSCITTGNIDEVGYDSNSFWKTCSEHYIAVYLED